MSLQEQFEKMHDQKEQLSQEISDLKAAGNKLARYARSLRLSVTAHPDYTGKENDEWTDLVEGVDNALAEWKEEKEPDQEGPEELRNTIIEFCYRHPDGRVEIKYQRIEGTPECDAMKADVAKLIESAKPDVSPYFYRKEGEKEVKP